MKNMKKITALILAGVLCTSSLSGIPTKTLIASDETSEETGASGLDVIDFQNDEDMTLFEPVNDTNAAWSIATESITENFLTDTDNKMLKLTSSTKQFTIYQIKEENIPDAGIKLVCGKVALTKYSEVFFVTKTDAKTNAFEGFALSSSGNNYILDRRTVSEAGDPKNYTLGNQYTDIPSTHRSYRQTTTLSTRTLNKYEWFDYELEYYKVETNVTGDTGYRANLSVYFNGELLFTSPTIVDGFGTSLKYSTYKKNSTVYLDDISICDHGSTKEVIDDQYLADEGDCVTPKTYYKCCTKCNKKTRETFETTVYAEHMSSVTEAGYDKLCDLCGYNMEPGNGTSALVNNQLIDFEKAAHRTLFKTKNNEAWANWGIVDSTVTDDTGNKVLKLTSSTSTALSKYQLKDQYVSGSSIISVSGKIAVTYNDASGVCVVTEYTNSETKAFEGFWIYSQNSKLYLMRAMTSDGESFSGNSQAGEIKANGYTDMNNFAWRVDSGSQLTLEAGKYIWLDYKLEYELADDTNGGGYRATMTLLQNDKELLKNRVVLDGLGKTLMYTTGKASSTAYLDDITVTMQENTCAHNNIANVVDDKYVASNVDCMTYKTYYKSCEDCGEAIISETFTSEVYGDHDLTEVPEVSGDCDNAGSIAHWDCSVCKKKFYDENAAQEVLKDEDLVIPAGHSLNEGYKNDATHHWQTCSKCETERIEEQAHTWDNNDDPLNPNKLKCKECGYVTEEDVLPMICGARIKADTDDAKGTQYLRYDIDFSAMRDYAESCGLKVTEYGVIAVGANNAKMTLSDVLAISEKNSATVKSQKDLSLLGDSGLVTVKIKRKAEDYGRRTTIVAFMVVNGVRYYSYNNEYKDSEGNTHKEIANNGIASKGVMDVIKHCLFKGEYSVSAPGETELTYKDKAFDNFWTAFTEEDYDYDEFAIWGDNPDKDTIKVDYLNYYISCEMTVPTVTTGEEYKQYQAAKQLAVCVFCEANMLALTGSSTQ